MPILGLSLDGGLWPLLQQLVSLRYLELRVKSAAKASKFYTIEAPWFKKRLHSSHLLLIYMYKCRPTSMMTKFSAVKNKEPVCPVVPWPDADKATVSVKTSRVFSLQIDNYSRVWPTQTEIRLVDPAMPRPPTRTRLQLIVKPLAPSLRWRSQGYSSGIKLFSLLQNTFIYSFLLTQIFLAAN